MTRTELDTFIENKGNGIVLFYSEHCKVCETQKLLFSRAIPNKYETVCCDLEVDYFIEKHNIDLIPVVIIYEDGKPVWRRDDLLQKEDVNFLIDYERTN